MKMWKSDNKGNYIYGDYVLTKVNNAFNDKSSYWISKKECAKAFYCFTPQNADNLKENMKEVDGWISYFEKMLNDNGIKELEKKANAYKKLYEVKTAQYEEAKQIIAKQANLLANGD